MTNVLILSVFRTHAQNGCHKVLEMESTSILKILALLLFENKQCIFSKIVSEYDQEIPQSQTADNPVAPRGRAAQPSRDTRKTN